MPRNKGGKGRAKTARDKSRASGKYGTTVASCPHKTATIKVLVRRSLDGTAASGVKIELPGHATHFSPKSGAALEYSKLKPGSYTVSASLPGTSPFYLDRTKPTAITENLKAGDVKEIIFYVRERASLEVKVFCLPLEGAKTYLPNIKTQVKGKGNPLDVELATAADDAEATTTPRSFWADIETGTHAITAPLEGELLERYEPAKDPVETVIKEGTKATHEIEIKPRNLKLVKVDHHFASSKEDLDITYDILRLKDREVMLRLYGYGDVLVYERPLTDAEKEDANGKIIKWDGKRNQDPKKDEYVNPLQGPFKVKLESGTIWKGELPFHVLYHSIALDWGVHTPSGDPPPESEQTKYAQYRLNVLGYDGGPVNGSLGTVTQNALKRFQRANYKVAPDTEVLLETTGTLDANTLAALKGSPVDRSAKRFEGGAIAVTADAKLYIEDNFFCDPIWPGATNYKTDWVNSGQTQFYSGDRKTHAEPLIERPYIALEVMVKLLTKADGEVEAPQAIGEVPIAWEMDDEKPDDAASKTITITVPPPLDFVTAAGKLNKGTVGSPYEDKLKARFGKPPYRFAVKSGSEVPRGLVFDPGSGAITGTPTGAGTTNISVEVTDAAGKQVSRDFSIEVIATPPLDFETPAGALPDAAVNIAYDQTVKAQYGKPAYRFYLKKGTELPSGLAFDAASGRIYGNPTSSGAVNLTVGLRDSVGKTASRAFTINIVAVVITTESIPQALLGKAYKFTLAAVGGQPKHKDWKVTPALPAGLTVNAASGIISGTATAITPVADYTFECTDRAGIKATKVLKFEVKGSRITTESLPDGFPGKEYKAKLAAEGNAPFTNWTVAAGTLPEGIKLDPATGAFSGKPKGAVQATLTFRCKDTGGTNVDKTLDLNIKYDLTITTAELPQGAMDEAYSGQLAADGGWPNYTWKITAGKLPKRVRLDASSGALTGKPDVAGKSKFTVEVSDSTGGAPVSKEFEIDIVDGLAITTPPALGEGRKDAAFEKTLTSSGGKAPLTWSLPANPAGWAIDGTGKLTGTPTAKGKLSIEVKVRDSSDVPKETTKTVTLEVVERQMTNAAPPDGTKGTAYPEQTMTPQGGTIPYTNYRVDEGALPPGLKIDPKTGKITGTPTAHGTFRAKIEATDSSTVPFDGSSNTTAKDFVLRAIQLGKGDKINEAERIDKNGDNILDTFGGFRKEDDAANVRSWFPNDADSELAPYKIAFYRKEKRVDKKTNKEKEFHCAVVKCWDHKTDHPKRRGKAGIYFRHSKIAGDDAKIRAALTFHDLPNKEELEKLHEARKDQLFKQSGRWRIWRRMRVSAYCQQRSPTRSPKDPNWGWAKDRWKEAFLEVENSGSPLTTLGYSSVITDSIYKDAVTSLPNGKIPTLYSGTNVTNADLTYHSGGVYGVDAEAPPAGGVPQSQENSYRDWLKQWTVQPIIALLREMHKKVRKTSPEGLIVYDYSIYHEAIEVKSGGAKLYDLNPSDTGYVFLDGAVTMDIHNTNDVSCYVLHEAGHGRFLHHHITSGASTNASDHATHHDKVHVRCTMSYPIDGDTPENWRYSFCGKCLLKLRGVDISALPSEYKP